MPGACGVIRHAEIDAIGRIPFGDPVFGGNCIMFVTHAPCHQCAGAIIGNGFITRVVYRHPYRADAVDFLRAHGIEVTEVKV